jgi:hypothetical protein
MLRGDSLLLLRDLPSDSVDALITDPPYSSGGAFRGDRTPASSTKYVASDSVSGQALPEVLGDSRDQRGLLVWSSIWLAECYRVVRDGGFVAVFSDWRQLSTFGDAVQAGGFITRGILPWIKPSARPQPGRPVQASEFVIWGSKGPMLFRAAVPDHAGLLDRVAGSSRPGARARAHDREAAADHARLGDCRASPAGRSSTRSPARAPLASARYSRGASSSGSSCRRSTTREPVASYARPRPRRWPAPTAARPRSARAPSSRRRPRDLRDPRRPRRSRRPRHGRVAPLPPPCRGGRPRPRHGPRRPRGGGRRRAGRGRPRNRRPAGPRPRRCTRGRGDPPCADRP